MDDEFALPDLFDDSDIDSTPTASGIVQCLRMLAEEAVALGLSQTLAALRDAMTVCTNEGALVEMAGREAQPADPAMLIRPADATLH